MVWEGWVCPNTHYMFKSNAHYMLGFECNYEPVKGKKNGLEYGINVNYTRRKLIY
jgi:hypothetical protein